MWGPGWAGCSRLTQIYGGVSSEDLGCEVPAGPQASPVEGAARRARPGVGPPMAPWSPPHLLLLEPPTALNPALNAPRRPQLCPDAGERLLEL